MTVKETKLAILFLNLGGPEKPEEVGNFLYRLFSDPEIIRINFAPLRKFIAWMISVTRENKSKALYRQIGGGSPILRLTNTQANEVEKQLQALGKDVVVRTAFTCSKPLIEDVVAQLYKNGARHFLSFPLYPQYSFTTTKSALDRVRAAVHKFARGSKVSEIRSWPEEPSFLKAHAELIQAEFQKFKIKNPLKTYLIFSAHSIPEKLVTQKGDPYKREVEKTVDGILKLLNWTGPWKLSWQSRLGPVKWLGPATVDVIRELGKQRAQNILIVPVAFVSDHIETLVEIDKEMKEEALKSGIQEFRRTPGLNNHPLFIKGLVDLAKTQSSFWKNR